MENNEMKMFDTKEIVSENIDYKKVIDQLCNALKADEDVCAVLKPLGLSNKEVRSNIGKLSEFQEDFNICKNCPGLDKCPKANKHISMYLCKEGDYLTTKLEPCKKSLEEAKINAQYVCKDFPEEWKQSTLKGLDLSENRRKVIKEFVNVVKGNSDKWIYLKGNHKVGKSYLLVTFANEFIALKLGKAAILDASKRFKAIADIAYTDKEAFNYSIKTLSSVPLLIIDNFGEEYINEFVRDQVVIPILNARNHDNLLTFFASEFSISEITKLYSVGKNGGAIRGKQLGNILVERCGQEFDLTGASIYKK